MASRSRPMHSKTPVRFRIAMLAILGAALMAVAVAGVALASGTPGGPQTSATDTGGDGGGSEGGNGGDETGPHATVTTLSCTPTQMAPVEATTCTATVTDTGGIPTAPSGSVAFSSDNPAQIFSTGACDLQQRFSDQSSCSVGYRPLAPGIHTITATYTGDGGHQPSPPAGVELTVAAPPAEEGGGGGEESPPPAPGPPAESSVTAAPNTMLNRQPQAKATDRRARFAFASNQAGGTFECKLDGAPFEPCASPFSANVKPGRHILLVRAINGAGVVDLTPAAIRWKVARIPTHHPSAARGS
jgi:hypothetical protein